MSDLAGLRVLVVEDEYLAAKWLKLQLSDLGCEVVGPVPTVPRAMRALDESEVDLGILDVQLADETSAAIATRMLAMHIGFAFLTGYSDLGMLPEELRGYRMLEKPLNPEAVHAALREMVAERA